MAALIARLATTRALVIATGALVAGLTLARVLVFWPRDTYIDTVSGIWTALAFDLSQGVLYRPVFGPDGYGGTRYFPLFFTGHATLIKMFGDPLWTGHVMAGLSVALVLAGLVLILRASGARLALAVCAAAFVLAPQVMQQALLGIRPDALATGLTVVGLAVLMRSHARAVPFAFILFGLSSAAKVSSVAGVAAGVLWLLSERRSREAALGVCVFAATLASVVAAAWWISDGRFVEVFAAGMGGTSSQGVMPFLMAPFTMLRLARTVPETAVFLELGAAIWLLSVMRRRGTDLVSLYWACAMVLAVPIFAVPGTAANHLVEPAAASVLIAAQWAIRRPDELTTSGAVLVVAALAASSALAWGLISRDVEQRWGTPAQAVALVPDRTRPILAENAAIPVAAGQRPYVLDTYMFQMMNTRDSVFGEPLWERMRRREFAAVVLERDPNSDKGRDWYRSGFFGPGFLPLLDEHYVLVGRSRSRVIYVAR